MKGKDKKRTDEPPHMGKLLHELKIWYGKSIEEFTATFDLSDKWFHLNTKKDFLTPENQSKICRGITKATGIEIPLNYFQGKFTLPIKDNSQEPPAEYKTQLSELRQENLKLKEDKIDLLEQVKHLHERMILLLEEKKTANAEHH